MALHIVKLCVGAASIDDLAAWVEKRRRAAPAEGRNPDEHIHRTRMMPKRREELLDGGSLYWVIRGTVLVRQKLLDIRAVTGADGVNRCDFVLDPTLIQTRPQPKRPFQGWRYLKQADAPRDWPNGGEAGEIPAAMRRELMELGLI